MPLGSRDHQVLRLLLPAPACCCDLADVSNRLRAMLAVRRALMALSTSGAVQEEDEEEEEEAGVRAHSRL